MAERMKALHLEGLFPVECWPPLTAVRELATFMKNRTRCNNNASFVYIDLKKYAQLSKSK